MPLKSRAYYSRVCPAVTVDDNTARKAQSAAEAYFTASLLCFVNLLLTLKFQVSVTLRDLYHVVHKVLSQGSTLREEGFGVAECV